MWKHSQAWKQQALKYADSSSYDKWVAIGDGKNIIWKSTAENVIGDIISEYINVHPEQENIVTGTN